MNNGLHFLIFFSRLGGIVLRLKVLLVLCFSLSPELWAGNLTEDYDHPVEPRSVSSGFEFKTIRYLDEGRSYFRGGAANSNMSYMFKTTGDLKFQSGIRAAWDVDTEYSAVENWNYFRPHELYAGIERPTGGLWFGRKKFVYSQWEERWNQALFQPRFLDDKLHATTAGLIGIFAEQDFHSLRLRGGFLPVSIPELGPNNWVADGEVVSKNPWFHPPPASFQFGGQITKIDYSVDRPDTWTAISKPGVIAQAEFDVSDSVLSRTSYAYKPMPQVLLAFPIVLKLPGTGFVLLKPRFLYHHVVNQDVVVKSGPAEFGGSVAFEHPVKDNLPDTWEQQNTADATIASAYASATLDEAKSWRVTGSVLKVWGGDRPDSGPVETKLTLFDRRYQFTEAGSVEVRKDWRVTAWPGLSSGLKLTYDHLENGLIYSGDALAQITKSFAARVSFDFFDLAAGGASMPDGFIDVYRGNDRISLGVSYVF